MFGSTNRLQWLLIYLALPVDGVSQMFVSSWDYYDARFVIDFAKLLVAKHRFETLVTYASQRKSESPPGLQLVEGSIERRLIQQLEMPIIVWGLSGNVSLYRLISHKTLVLTTIEHYAPQLVPMLQVLHETLERRHNVHVLFIMRYQSPSRQQLKTFFSWCWTHNFVNVAVTFQQVHNQLFTYTPFPSVQVINVTSFGVDYEWSALNNADVKGYEFRMPVFKDPPGSFLLPDGRLRGVTGLLVSSYIKHINGRLKVEPLHNVDRSNFYKQALLAAARNEIEFGPHPITSLELNANKTAIVYSHTLSRTCLMVPWMRVTTIRTLYRSYPWSTYSIVFVMALGWQLYARQAVKGFYLGLCILYQQAMCNNSFERLPRLYKFAHLLMLLGICIVNCMRSAHLSAAFSVHRLAPQINSIDDLLESPYHIMLTETDYKMYFDTGLLPAELQDRLVIVNRSTLSQHRDNLDTSFAYLATTAYINRLQIKQRYLQRPRFRIVDGPQLCTASFYLGLPIQWNSPFQQHFLHFYLKTLRNGLQDQWTSCTNMDLLRLGVYTTQLDDGIPFVVISLSDFDLFFKTYGLAVLCCLLCLLIEILCKRLTSMF
ncbi:hypothetical protein KR093_010712 [Drosophila rubida]|uniref:Ionotropic receptor n=1 Tax=Drosophila rubida TaxID=30044 RepID=A0AAD4PH27_9MUSC|nr:hypothetical protein KR093_010712 [Drosophila rubida]